MPHPYALDLPASPDPEQQRKRAKDLLKALRAGDAGALARIRYGHPWLVHLSADEILANARLSFAARIEALKAGRASEPFRTAFEAIRDDDRATLAAVLAAHPGLVNAKGTNGNRLLMLAISLDRLTLAGDLLDAGADPSLANDKGWGPLHDVAYGGGRGELEVRLRLLDRLIAAGGSIEAEAYGDGGSPLAVALFWGHGAIAERLAAEVVTPLNLRIAAGLGRLDLIDLFFDAGGALRPEAGHHRGFYRPHSGFPEWRMTDAPQELLDEALTWAARSGRIAAMDALLGRGAAIDAAPYNGTALHWALLGHRPEAAEWLVEWGADIDGRAACGDTADVTPLHVAAGWANDLRSARLLKARGADLTIRDRTYGATAIDWAEHFSHPEIAALLKSGLSEIS